VLFLSGGPVRNFEALENGAWVSVETYITNSLQEGVGVEVLSKNVMLNIGLLVEFIAIEVLNSNTYIILN
jgi:hypothetical protein